MKNPLFNMKSVIKGIYIANVGVGAGAGARVELFESRSQSRSRNKKFRLHNTASWNSEYPQMLLTCVVYLCVLCSGKEIYLLLLLLL
jgi:hypothetical protein